MGVVDVPVTKQRGVPMVQTVQRPVEVPQIQYVDEVVEVPVTKQRQVPMVQTVQRPVEVPQVQIIDEVVDVPVTKQRHVPQVQTVEKVVEIPQLQVVERVVEAPQVGQTVQGAQRAVNIPCAPVRQVAPAEIVQVTEVGPPLPAEMGA